MDVLLYSKYSNASKALMTQLENTPELIQSLTLTCIDNKQIRERICNDEKIKIKTVPCLIRLNDETGNFDIYEGDNLFNFFKSIQQKIINDKLDQERQQQEIQYAKEIEKERMTLELEKLYFEKEKEKEREKQEKEKQEKENENDKERHKEKKKNQYTHENILNEAKRQENIRNESQKQESQKQVRFDSTKPEPKITKQKISTSLSSSKIAFTPIDELDLDDKDDSNSINTYTHVSKTENTDFNDRDIGIKNAEQSISKGGGSLLSRAMKLQKEREA